MSKFIKSLAVLASITVVSACAQAPVEEVVMVDPEPISVEPTYTGKYK